MQRIPSGIAGLDELLGGGFLKRSVNLVSGTTGSGKTTFALQFLLATENAECGLLITSDQKPQETLKYLESKFSWNIKNPLKEKKLVIAKSSASSLKEFLSDIKFAVHRYPAEKIAIDANPSILLQAETTFDAKSLLREFFSMLRKSGATCLVATETSLHPKSLSLFGVEEFLADSVLFLEKRRIGSMVSHKLHIRKMRGSPHSHKIHPIELTKDGLRVHSQ